MPVGRRSRVCTSNSLQQPAADRLAGAALEQHVVGQDDGRPAVDLEDRLDVLDEVQLLVRGGDHEVVPHDLQVVAASRPSAPIIVTDDLRPNGGLASTTEQRSPGSAMSASLTSIERVAVRLCRCRAAAGSSRPAGRCRRPARCRGRSRRAGGRARSGSRSLGVARGVGVSGEQEAARAAGRVDDGVAAAVGWMQSTIAAIRARGVKYCPAPDLMSSAPLASSSS